MFLIELVEKDASIAGSYVDTTYDACVRWAEDMTKQFKRTGRDMPLYFNVWAKHSTLKLED